MFLVYLLSEDVVVIDYLFGVGWFMFAVVGVVFILLLGGVLYVKFLLELYFF